MLRCSRVLHASVKAYPALKLTQRCCTRRLLAAGSLAPHLRQYAQINTLEKAFGLSRRLLHNAPSGQAQTPSDALVAEGRVSPPWSEDVKITAQTHRGELPPRTHDDFATNSTSLLDAFLPPGLRLSSSEANSIRPVLELPEILYLNRVNTANGALTALAQGQERLHGFVYLAKALGQLEYTKPAHAEARDLFLTQSLWRNDWQSSMKLSRRTEDSMLFDVDTKPTTATTKLRDATGPAFDAYSADYRTHYQSAMGEVWLNLGLIAIQASQSDAQEAQRLMDHVYEVIAHLHSHDHIPPSIYGYDDDDVPTMRRKPPYLHVMSSRMMTALSDATWRLQDQDIANMFDFNGGETDPYMPVAPITRGAPNLRPLPPNTWLEFILWCCTSNGYILEAANLLSTILSSRNNTKWSPLRWQEVLRLQRDHHRRRQSWFDQVASLFEGYSEERPLIEMPSDSISSEVVQVVFESLLALPRESAETLSLLNATLDIRLRSEFLKHNDRSRLEINGLLLRSSNLAPIDADTLADIYADTEASKDTHATFVGPAPAPKDEDDDSAGSIMSEFARDTGDDVRTSLIVALDERVAKGMIAEAELTSERLQYLSKTVTPDETGRSTKPSSVSEEDDPGPSILVEIPDTTLSEYLRLAMRTSHNETAKHILQGSGMIPESAAGQKLYQSTLLKAALAFSDTALLRRILFHFDISFDKLSSDILQALVEAQILTDKLASNPRILRILCQERGEAPSSRIITLYAVKVIEEARQQRHRHQRNFNQPYKRPNLHLRQLLGRIFVPRTPPGKTPDYTLHREHSQLARIFVSVGGELAEVAAEFADVRNPQLAGPVAISADTFNVLLEAVSRTESWQAARKLFESWCSFEEWEAETIDVDGLPVRRPRFEDKDGQEKVVIPDVASVKAVLIGSDPPINAHERILAFRKSLALGRPQQLRVPQLLSYKPNNVGSKLRVDWKAAGLPPKAEWAAEQYARMKLSGEEIEELLAGFLPRRAEETDMTEG